MEGCCRKCLRGTPAGYDLKKKPIKELMDKGEIDPYQIASAFHIGSAYQAPYFKDIVINMKSEAKPCKYPGNCEQKCVLCFSLIINSDDVELDIWPGFKVHKACTSPCLYPCCRTRLPTLPAYLSLQRSTLMCDTHKDSNAFHRVSISTATAVQERKEAISAKKLPTMTMLPQPGPGPEIRFVPTVLSDPAVKKTHTFKKPLGKAKADKFDERGKSKSILKFFQTPRAAANLARKAIQEDALKASKMDDAPRRFLRNKETGEIFGEWKGDRAYRIGTDEELSFTRDKVTFGAPAKFDYSPPVSMNSEQLLEKESLNTSVSSDEKQHDEGESSP
jgi:hypothetical protein